MAAAWGLMSICAVPLRGTERSGGVYDPPPPNRSSVLSSTRRQRPGRNADASGLPLGAEVEESECRCATGPFTENDEHPLAIDLCRESPLPPGAEHGTFAAQLKQRPVVLPQPRMRFAILPVPGELGPVEAGGILRVRYVASPSQGGEFLAPAAGDRRPKIRILEVGDEEERRALPILLTHEEQRHICGDEEGGGGQLELLGGHQRGEPLSLGTIPHLVMVLYAHDEPLGGDVDGRRPVRSAAVSGVLPVVDESVGVRLDELLRKPKILIVPATAPQ